MQTANMCHPNPRHPTLVATLVFAVFSLATTVTAQHHTTIGDLPLALICAKGDVTVIGYLASINADGSAVYLTPANIVVAVSPEGVVDNRADGICAGKSLDELRDNGQTRAFPE